MRGTTCLSDHRLLRSRVAFIFKSHKKKVRTAPVKKINVTKLSSPDTRAYFQQELATVLLDFGPTAHETKKDITTMSDRLHKLPCGE